MKPGPDKSFDPATALNAASEVFRARGFEGASLSELTAAMGIGRKSLYDTFGSKRSLFQQSVHAYAAENAAALRSLLLGAGSPGENLRSLLHTLRDNHSQPCSHGCLIGSCLADFDAKDPEAMASLRSALVQLENVFFEAFTRARDEGETSATIDPHAAARMLVCFSQGSAIVGRADVGSEYLAVAYQLLEELLF